MLAGKRLLVRLLRQFAVTLISLTPGFSQVVRRDLGLLNRFNGLE